jgi:hypothetical protein
VSERLTATRNVWLAAYLFANGLPFVRATRLAGPNCRVNFFFADPDDAARALTRRFLDDAATHRLIDGRRAMGEVIDAVRRGGWCEAADADVAEVLALLTIPWAERTRAAVHPPPIGSPADPEKRESASANSD